jgi:hypothetical protein
VHLEALKLGMQPIVARAPRPLADKLLRFGLGLSGTVARRGLLYYLLSGVEAALGAAAPWVIGRGGAALYAVALQQAAACPDLPEDIDIERPQALETWPTVRAGLHFLLPDRHADLVPDGRGAVAALSAFWAIVVLLALMLTQRPLIRLLRGSRSATAVAARPARGGRRPHRRQRAT